MCGRDRAHKQIAIRVFPLDQVRKEAIYGLNMMFKLATQCANVSMILHQKFDKRPQHLNGSN